MSEPKRLWVGKNSNGGDIVADSKPYFYYKSGAYYIREDLLRDSSYWVVEFVGSSPRCAGGTNYACIRDVDDPAKEGFMDWTLDIHEAVKFHREQDATLFAKMFFWADFHECVAIREHIDLSAPQSNGGQA